MTDPTDIAGLRPDAMTPPAAKAKKPRSFKYAVLSAGEILKLDDGEVEQREISAKEAYVQERIIRLPQQVKDLCIQESIDRWLRQLDRFGATAADKRHARRVMHHLVARFDES